MKTKNKTKNIQWDILHELIDPQPNQMTYFHMQVIYILDKNKRMNI